MRFITSNIVGILAIGFALVVAVALLLKLSLLTPIVAFLAAWVRVGHTHPAYAPTYAKWLASTPWQLGMPLPKGSVNPPWKDALFIGLLTLLAIPFSNTLADVFDIAALRWLLIASPALFYLLGLATAWTAFNWYDDFPWPVYAVMAVPPLIALPPAPLWCIAFAPLLMAPIAWWGMRLSLKRFPWPHLFDPTKGAPKGQFNTLPPSQRRNTTSIVGWPYEQLLGEVKEFRRAWKIALLQAVLAGLWVVLLARVVTLDGFGDRELNEAAVFLAFWGTNGVAAWRFFRYAKARCAKFCLGFRLGAGRLIVPEQDARFGWLLLAVASNLVAVAIFASGFYGQNLPEWVAVVGAGVWTACWVFVLRTAGPDVKHIHLTGIQQIGPSLLNKQNYVKISGEKASP